MDSWGVAFKVDVGLRGPDGENTEKDQDNRPQIMELFADHLSEHLEKEACIENLQIKRMLEIDNKTIKVDIQTKSDDEQKKLKVFIDDGRLQKLIDNLMQSRSDFSNNVYVHVIEEGIDVMNATSSQFLEVQPGREITFFLYCEASSVEIVLRYSTETKEEITMESSKTFEKIFVSKVHLPNTTHVYYNYIATFSQDKYGCDNPVIVEEQIQRCVPQKAVRTVRDTWGIQKTSKIPENSIISHCSQIIIEAEGENFYESTYHLYSLLTQREKLNDKKKREILICTKKTTLDRYYVSKHNYLLFLTMMSCFGYFDVLDIISPNQAMEILSCCQKASKSTFYKWSHIHFHAILMRITKLYYQEKTCVLLLMKHAYPFLDEKDCFKLIKHGNGGRLSIFIENTVDTTFIGNLVERLCKRILNHGDETDGMALLNMILNDLPSDILHTSTSATLKTLRQHNSVAVAKNLQKTILECSKTSLSKVKTFCALKKIAEEPAFCHELSHIEAIIGRTITLCSAYEGKNLSADDYECLKKICVCEMTRDTENHRKIIEALLESKHDFNSLLPRLFQHQIPGFDAETCQKDITKWMKMRIKTVKRKQEMIERVYTHLCRCLEIACVKQNKQLTESLEFDVLKCVEKIKIDSLWKRLLHMSGKTSVQKKCSQNT